MTPIPAALAVAAFRADSAITGQVAAAQIGTALHGIYPAIRITAIGGPARPTIDTGAPEIQWEVWGETDAELFVAQTAQIVDEAIESGELVGTYASVGTIIGTWTVSGPFSSPDPTTSRPRYLGTLGLLSQ